MVSGKPKQFVRPPPKKKQQKAATLESIDDFQEAADFEEAAGGKHRVGDPIKSARAFVRALDVYDQGLAKHPNSFDLAYNKARLQLELSQHEHLVDHIGLPMLDWLRLTLKSHRYALKLTEDNPDVLFNTAQILTSLAEALSEDDRSAEAVPLLHEALELLSSCLSKQEMMYEQHRLDFPDNEDGGVPLNPEPDEAPAPVQDTDMGDEQSAIVEVPISPNDLLDTVHASISALITLVPLADQPALQNLGDMAQTLTESKAPDYIRLLTPEEQDQARFSAALDRAAFIAAFANAQFEAQLIELQTYLERIDATFSTLPNKQTSIVGLHAEAQARAELVLSCFDRAPNALPAMLCWKQLGLAQELYSAATKLDAPSNSSPSSEETPSRAEIYKAKGDVELLRHRVSLVSNADVTDGVRKSAQTLLQNAQTFYKGAVSHAQIGGEEKVAAEAGQRRELSEAIAGAVYGNSAGGMRGEGLPSVLQECVEEGLVSEELGRALITGDSIASSS